MISPFWATAIIVAFIIVFGVGVPIMDKWFPKYISYRWCVVVVVLALPESSSALQKKDKEPRARRSPAQSEAVSQ